MKVTVYTSEKQLQAEDEADSKPTPAKDPATNVTVQSDPAQDSDDVGDAAEEFTTPNTVNNVPESADMPAAEQTINQVGESDQAEQKSIVHMISDFVIELLESLDIPQE